MATHPWFNLTPDNVINIIESQGFLTDLRLLVLNSYENRVYQVGIEDEAPLIAKFYRPERWSDEQILQEHKLTRHLYEQDLSVVPPNLYPDGSLMHKDGFRFSLFDRQGGHPPELDNFDTLEQLGRTLAMIHNHACQVDLSQRPAISGAERAIAARDYILENNWIPSPYRQPWEEVTAVIIEKIEEAFDMVAPDLIGLHGDCHPGNILWRDDKPHFVDFDDCCRGPAIQDLWMFLSGDREDQLVQIDTLIEAYSMFRDIAPKELKLIEPLRATRQLHYCAWLAQRWDDPAFPMHFPWFNTERYWGEQVLNMREQLSALEQPALTLPNWG